MLLPLFCVFLIIVALLSVSYIYFWITTNQANRRKYEYNRPSYPFGSFQLTKYFEYTFSEIFKKIYDQMKSRYSVYYFFTFPVLILKDPEIIKQLFITDSNYFMDRGLNVNSHDPFAYSIATSSQEQSWKELRQKLAPTFAPNRLKCLVETSKKHLKTLEIWIDKPENKVVDIYELMNRYNMMVIATESFGIDEDFLTGESVFRTIMKNAVKPNWETILRLIGNAFMPYIMDKFHINLFNSQSEKYSKELFLKIMKYREENNIVQKDFVQLIINLYKTDKTMCLSKIAAQPFVLTIAATETMVTALTFCLYELALRPDIQKKAQENIDEILQKYDGQLTYESIKEMKFVEYCIDETLRLNPVFAMVARSCTKDYKMPDSDYVIKKRDLIFVPLLGLQTDPKYFKNPTIFDPDRFGPERREGNSGCFFPFGLGPRFCFGKLYAKIIAQLTLCTLLSKYDFKLSDGMPSKLEFFKLLPVHVPKTKILLNITPRQ